MITKWDFPTFDTHWTGSQQKKSHKNAIVVVSNLVLRGFILLFLLPTVGKVGFFRNNEISKMIFLEPGNFLPDASELFRAMFHNIPQTFLTRSRALECILLTVLGSAQTSHDEFNRYTKNRYKGWSFENLQPPLSLDWILIGICNLQ